ncbi:unnamed protein product [Menidia menidia]|uniref:(Atlantic silverside) hypothetical protein n=1 Tax=Menidia menidia TaxID=238744 RepID=A0A8S4BDV3_9TELE|nr:unnamed protein product [Menidia menidia]
MESGAPTGLESGAPTGLESGAPTGLESGALLGLGPWSRVPPGVVMAVCVCAGQCKPGSHSLNGLEICESCPLGHFQPAFGARECLLCPGETSTVTRGAVDPAECGVPCAAGHFSRTGLVPCYPCPRDYYQPEHGRSYCLSCPFYGTTTVTGATSIQHCSSSFLPKEESVTAAPEVEVSQDYQASSQVFHECFLNPCQNKGTCEEVGAGYVCTCAAGFTGAKCEVDINECDSAPCQNGGLCQDGMGSFQCQCQPGFLGGRLRLCLCPRVLGSSLPGRLRRVPQRALPPRGVLPGRGQQLQPFLTCFWFPSPAEMSSAFNLDFEVSGIHGYVMMDGAMPALTEITCTFWMRSLDTTNYGTPLWVLYVNGKERITDCPAVNTGQWQHIGVSWRSWDGDWRIFINGKPSDGGKGLSVGTTIPEMSSAFNLDFEVSGIHGYVMMDGAMPALTEITCTFWMRSSDTTNYGTPLWVLYVNGKERITDCPAVNTGQWQHIGVSWRSWDGDWRIFINGKPSDGGKGLSQRLPHQVEARVAGQLHLGAGAHLHGGNVQVGRRVLQPRAVCATESPGYQRLRSVNPWLPLKMLLRLTRTRPTTPLRKSGQARTFPRLFLYLLWCEDPVPDVELADGPHKGLHRVEALAPLVLLLTQDQRPPACGHTEVYHIKVLASSCPSSHVTHRGNVLAWPDFLSGVVGRVRVNLSSIFCADCPRLQDAAPHLHVSSVEVGPGAQVQLSCDPGFYLVGEPLLQCQNKGEWSHPNGLFRGEDFQAGGSVEYECDAGFYLLGDARLLCGNSGQWGGHPPACLDVDECALGSDCDPHARCQNTEGSYSCSCTPPYTGDGKNCTEPVRCPDPGAPEFGHRAGSSFLVGGEVAFGCEVRGRYTFSSRVTYACNAGYQLLGRAERECQANRQWSAAPSCKDGRWEPGRAPGRAPFCSPARCPEPPLEARRLVLRALDAAAGTVELSCEEGFVLRGARFLRCTPSREWNATFPECRPALCGPPPEVAFATAVAADDAATPDADSDSHGSPAFPVGATVTYACMSGFSLRPGAAATASCMASGAWSSPLPECAAAECPQPAEVADGVVDVQGLAYLSRAQYSCRPGFRLLGNATMLCGERGQWLGAAPTCRPVECPPPAEIPAGSVAYTKLQFGHSATYSCRRGYRLQGAGTVSCRADGEWDGAPPACLPISCPPPRPLASGFVEGRDHGFGATIFYSCFPGYQLAGADHLTCEEAGWSGAAPACVRSDCGLPPHIDFGDYRRVSESTDGARQNGALMDGARQDGAQMDGAWKNGDRLDGAWPEGGRPDGVQQNGAWQNGAQTDGARKDGARPDGVQQDGARMDGVQPDGVQQDGVQPDGVQPDLSFLHGSLIEYRCHRGYELTRPTLLACQEDGAWNGTAPACVPVACEPPPRPAHGGLNLTAIPPVAVATYWCEDGYELNGERERRCVAGRRWSGAAPVCRPRDCGDPGAVGNATATGGDFSYPGAVHYECHAGFVLRGADTIGCQADGRWSGPPPRCDIISCDPPADISHGFVNGSSFAVGAAVEYVCFQGYRVSGDPVLRCTPSGAWAGAVPTCEPCVCTPPLLRHGAVLAGGELGGHLGGGELGGVLGGGGELTDGVLGGGGVLRGVERGGVLGGGELGGHLGGGLLGGDGVLGGHLGGGKLGGGERGSVPGDGKLDGDGDLGGHLGGGHPGGGVLGGHLGGGELPCGTALRFRCDDGFRLLGPAHSVCGAGGLWAPGVPLCARGRCGDAPPPAVANGVLQGGAIGGGGLLYRCRPGFRPRGSPLVACGRDGRWAEPRLSCEAASCGRPPEVANATATGDAFTFPNQVTYRCDDGYELATPSSSLSCQSDGTWSRLTVACRPAPCRLPNATDPRVVVSGGGLTPVGGALTPVGGALTPVGGRVALSCPPGFSLKGPALADISSASCVAAGCDKPRPLLHGLMEGDRFGFGDAVRFSCLPGFLLKGDSTQTCQEDKTWSGTRPVCVEAGGCQAPPLLMHGSVHEHSLSTGRALEFHHMKLDPNV